MGTTTARAYRLVGETVMKLIGLYVPFDIGKRTVVRRWLQGSLARGLYEPSDRRVVRRSGVWFEAHMVEEIDQWIYLTGSFERADCNFALAPLTPGAVVLDVGANVGSFALRAAQRVGPRGVVIAFEPNPAAFDRLVANVRLNGFENVTPVNLAVADCDGLRELFLRPLGHLGEASFHPRSGDAPGVASPRGNRRPVRDPSVAVPAVSVDSWASTNNVRSVDLIKIDVEGSEPGVLLGAQETIQRCRPRLMVECNRPTLALGGWEAEGLLGLLQRLGYRVYERTPWTNRLKLLRGGASLSQEMCNLHCVPS